MNFLLRRDDQNDIRTLGAMFDGDERICETLELPWRDNQRGISCIPEGIYECKLAHSPSRGYDVYWLERSRQAGRANPHRELPEGYPGMYSDRQGTRRESGRPFKGGVRQVHGPHGRRGLHSGD